MGLPDRAAARSYRAGARPARKVRGPVAPASYTARVTKKRVLIVDDEPVTLRLLERVFEQFHHGHDYEIETVRDGADALMALLRQPCDLVLLDMQMPRLGGLELLKQMQGLDLRVPVLMLTATQDSKAAGEALRSGVFAFVPKPVDPQQLDHLVALALSTTPSA
jgi:DNA-binding NtrC family response regulator